MKIIFQCLDVCKIIGLSNWRLRLIANSRRFCNELYSPRNDPDPEMIPNPEMIPKLTPKWSQPRNDPHFSSCRPRNDPQGIMEWWLNMGLWIDFLFFVQMLNAVISFYSYEISNNRKVVVGSLFRYNPAPVSFQWTFDPAMWLHYVSRSPPFIKTLITFSYKCFYKLHLSQNFPYS